MSVRLRTQPVCFFCQGIFWRSATSRSPLHNCCSCPFYTEPQMANFWYLSRHFVLRRKPRIGLRSSKWYWMPLPAGNVNLPDQELNILNKWNIFPRTVLASISILNHGNWSVYSVIGKGMKRKNNLSGGGDSWDTFWVWPAQIIFQKGCSNFHHEQQMRPSFSVRKDMIKLELQECWW